MSRTEEATALQTFAHALLADTLAFMICGCESRECRLEFRVLSRFRGVTFPTFNFSTLLSWTKER